MKEETLKKKQQVIDEIAEKIQKAESLAIVEYKGISVADVTELRNTFRNGGVEYKIYKNTMVARALEQLGIAGFDEVLNGPNAFIFSNEDMNLPSKEVLLSMVLGALQAPISGLASVCNAEITSLLYALKAIEEKQEGGEGSAA